MYIYIHIYICISMYVYIYIYMYPYIFMFVSVHINKLWRRHTQHAPRDFSDKRDLGRLIEIIHIRMNAIYIYACLNI